MGITGASKVAIRKEWSQHELSLAREARTLSGMKLAQLIRKLQISSGRRKRDCMSLIQRSLEQDSNRRPWTEEEYERLRELVASHSIETVATKLARSADSVRCALKRQGISIREMQNDFFTIYSLAEKMKVRKTEILFWIDQGWLEKTSLSKDGVGSTRISPASLHRCFRLHMGDIQRRNVKSAPIFEMIQDYCYVPKHTTGEQSLQVREAKRERQAYAQAMLS